MRAPLLRARTVVDPPAGTRTVGGTSAGSTSTDGLAARAGVPA